MKKHQLLIIISALLGITLACNLPQFPTQPDFATDAPVHQVVPLTPEIAANTDVPLPTITQNNVPPTVAVAAPTTAPIAAPTDTQPAPVALPAYYPSGFVAVAGDQRSVTIYNLQGQPLAVVRTPGMSVGSPDSVHVMGSVAGSADNVPVIFINMENQGRIMHNLNDQITVLIPGPDVANLRGSPGENTFIFTNVWRANDGSAISQLYVYNPAAGNTTQVHEWIDTNSTVIFPLVFNSAAASNPNEIWLTHRLWGIGGDIVFPPQEGLFYFDLTTQQETLVLTVDFKPIGLSPDQAWVAYVPTDQGYSEGVKLQVTLYDLISGLMVQIPLVSGNDRGAGYAAFSPDDRYVAWMEGSGRQMAEVPNFTSLVRVADMNGNIFANLPVGTLASVTGVANPTWAKPVGWLDGETLIVEIRGDDWNNPALVRVRFDGSGIAYLAQGGFAGFVYP